jgi:glycosyltransferase involved in cell wall biosynthesis
MYPGHAPILKVSSPCRCGYDGKHQSCKYGFHDPPPVSPNGYSLQESSTCRTRKKGPKGNYGYRGAAEYLFKHTLQAPANIVLSDKMRAIYERAGYRGLLRVLPNGAEVEKYRVVTQGNGRAICLGRMSSRKNQAWLGEIARHRTDGSTIR